MLTVEVFVRVGDKSKKLNFEQRLQLVYAKGVKYFENQPVAAASIFDIDMPFVDQYIRKIGYTKGNAEFYLRHNNDFIITVDGEDKVSCAAILFPHVVNEDEQKILEFCSVPRSRQEIMEYMNLTDRKHFGKYYLEPLLAPEKLSRTIPDKPKSRMQKYVAIKSSTTC